MNVFVFEHLCGGVTPSEAAAMPVSMLRQGAAMLQAAADDFAALGAEVSTMLHDHAPVKRNGRHITVVEDRTDICDRFDALAARADATLVIAPECDDVLGTWLDRIDVVGGVSLGCAANAARLCGDKLAVAALDIATPPARTFTGDARDFDFPVVVKPRRGAGCERTFICREHDDVATLDRGEDWILQPFVPGRSVSASLIVHGPHVRPLPCGEQDIIGERSLHYRGGRLPLDHESTQRITRLAQDTVRRIPGMRGFVGVDVVLGETANEDRVIEINPRLTMSYVALRRMCKNNLAAAMLGPDAPLTWRDEQIAFDAEGKLRPELAV